MIRNVHERVLAASPEAVGGLLDSLGSDDDRLWPRGWPAVRLDRPLQVGADGGHGPIRYTMTAYEPGRTAVFRFHDIGMDGYHRFDVLPGPEGGGVLLRHELVGRPGPRMAVAWTLAFRPMHDALLEDLLDGAELELTGAVRTARGWSPWVRVIRGAARPRAARSRPVAPVG